MSTLKLIKLSDYVEYPFLISTINLDINIKDDQNKNEIGDLTISFK